MRCEANTAKGQRCKAPALKDGPFCALHANPDRPRQMGSKGGQAARKKAVLPKADFTLKSPQDVAQMLESACNAMLRGELDRGLASCAGYLGQGIIKALEQGDLERRIAALEEGAGGKS
ncbi:MAG: hypothetical protein V2A77_09035 [Pseudomonadota bacterium]